MSGSKGESSVVRGANFRAEQIRVGEPLAAETVHGHRHGAPLPDELA